MINQRQIKNLMYATLNEIKAATGRDNELCYCVATGIIYRYLTDGSAYTANDNDILITGNGGDTRWISSNTDSTIARFKKGTGTYTDDDTSQDFADAFCTADSLVIISVTDASTPQGVWTVTSGAGSFTITSTVAETDDIDFDYYIIKGV